MTGYCFVSHWLPNLRRWYGGDWHKYLFSCTFDMIYLIPWTCVSVITNVHWSPISVVGFHKRNVTQTKCHFDWMLPYWQQWWYFIKKALLFQWLCADGFQPRCPTLSASNQFQLLPCWCTSLGELGGRQTINDNVLNTIPLLCHYREIVVPSSYF